MHCSHTFVDIAQVDLRYILSERSYIVPVEKTGEEPHVAYVKFEQIAFGGFPQRKNGVGTASDLQDHARIHEVVEIIFVIIEAGVLLTLYVLGEHPLSFVLDAGWDGIEYGLRVHLVLYVVFGCIIPIQSVYLLLDISQFNDISCLKEYVYAIREPSADEIVLEKVHHPFVQPVRYLLGIRYHVLQIVYQVSLYTVGPKEFFDIHGEHAFRGYAAYGYR